MRPEKTFLTEEIGAHLDKSNYVFLTDFARLSVPETEELRGNLAKENAEFHIVKNSLFRHAAKVREFPELDEHLNGPTAIVVGGENAPSVAKVLTKFFKEKEKVEVKVGVMDKQALSKDEVKALADLPSREELLGKLLGTLLAPASNLARLLNTPGTQLATVLDKRKEQLEAAG